MGSDSMPGLKVTEIECDTSFSRLANAVDRAARRVGSRLDDLVGVRFTSRCVMSPTDFVLGRRLPNDPASAPR